MLAALPWFLDAGCCDSPDVGVAHVRDGGAAVKAAFLLHLDDDVVKELQLILVKQQLIKDQMIPAYDLACGEPHGYACLRGMVLNEVDHGMDASVHGAAVVVRTAEILFERAFLIHRYVNCMLHKLVNTLVLCRRDGDNRDTEHRLHGVDVHRAAVSCHLVHHVQCHDRRNSKFQ